MPATFTWIGPNGTAAGANDPLNWTPAGGPPGLGDSGLFLSGGTVLLGDGLFESNTAALDGGRMIFAGGAGVNLGSPSLDLTSLITTNTGDPVARVSTIDALGNFVNDGTILAHGAAGSSLIVNIGTTIFGTVAAPGYFFNPGLIQADAGNTLTINIGAGSAMFNSGQILANAGTVVISVDPAAIAGGYAPVLGFVDIGGGGTVETNASYASTVTGQTPTFAFVDGTSGNTLIIDNPAAFSGRILGFGKGDTIDLGGSLAIGKAVYSKSSGILNLEDATGTIVESLLFATGGFQPGTFILSGTTLGSFNLGTGTNGHTVITTDVQIPAWNNTSGTWQTAANWSGAVVPGALDTPLIGAGSSTPFTLTTGATPVTAAGFDLVSRDATLQITSDTTTTDYVDGIIGGTLRISNNSTLNASAIRAFTAGSSVIVDGGSILKLTGHSNTTLMSSAGTLAVSAGNTIGAIFGAGTAVVNGAILAGPTNPATGGGGDILIGLDSGGSPASVTVNAGGTVTDTYSLLGSDPTSFGSLTLNGAGANWTDMVDAADPSSVRGFMLLGFNSLSNNTPAGLPKPTLAHAAQLLVTNGATLTEQQGAFIGNNADSAGEATISAGGLWNIAVNNIGVLSVGQVGSGTLSVLNGGSVAVGGAGTIVGTSTSAAVSGGIGVGSTAGATGTLIVSGASSAVSTLFGMSVGRGGNGLVNVLNGGQIDVNAGSVNVGNSAGATGTLNVGGSGAAAALKFGAGAGGLTVGNAGSGTVTVSDAGTIALNGANGGLGIGSAAGSTGTVVVAGTTASAVINLGTRGMVVGDAGTGTLAIGTLGTVALTGTNGIGIGQTTGAIGVITVDGGRLTEGASAAGIGVAQADGATGSLRILNGGTVSLAGGGISAGATAATADGSISVDGLGSLFETTGTGAVTIGQSGTGTLTVTNGGRIANANRLTIGQNANSSGFVTVTGGTLNANNLSIDSDASLTARGTLTVGAGGIVNVASKGTINANGVIDLKGGILNVSTAATNPGGVLLLNNGATLKGFGQVNLGKNDTGLLSSTGATIVASGGTLDLGFGTGAMTIEAGAALKLDAGVSNTASIKFATGGQETLLIGGTISASASFSINNWSNNDRLEFTNGEVASSAVLSAGTLTVSVSGPVFISSYQFTNVSLGAGQDTTFLTGIDGVTGNSFVQLACFAEGTLIRTADGDVAVEDLRAGQDRVPSALNGETAPVVWVGRTTIDCQGHARPETVWPVRVAAGAFGVNTPARDLWLSPDHAVFVEGVLVPVKLLINGASIVQVPKRQMTYFHVELPRHEVIFAEGLAVESYLDTGDRANFGRGDGVVRLHADFASRLAPSAAAIWETRGAAPLVLSGAALAKARRAVAACGRTAARAA